MTNDDDGAVLAAPKRKKRDITHKIKQWRRYRGLTLDELGTKCGLTGSLISQIELGRSRYSQKSLEAMAKALDCTAGQLLDVDPFEEGVKALQQSVSTEWHTEVWESFPPEQRDQVREMLRFAEEGALKSARLLFGYVKAKSPGE